MEVHKVELMQNKLYFVGSKQLKINSLAELAELPMIYREQGSATRKAMEDFFKFNDLKPKNSLELVSNEAVKQAVCAGLGYSIMPLIGMQNELKSGELQIVPVKGLPIVSSWNLIYSKNKKLSLAAKAFVQHIEESKAHIIEKSFSKVNVAS
jgi:DNA-binding transcriptional LysR family regulator